MILPFGWASCTNDCARAPWVGGVNGACPVTTVVHVVAVCAECWGRPLSRVGWPVPFASAAFGSCPTRVSEVGTASLLARTIVSPVVLIPAVAVYGTVMRGGCQTPPAPLVPAVCAAPLVCVQVAPPLAGNPVPPVPLPQNQPHIGMMLPSGATAACRTAVRLTTGFAAAIPAVRRRADPIRIAVLSDFLVIPMFSSNSQSFVDVPDRRINQHHHQHAARKHIVGRNLTLVMRMPHEGDAGLER